MDVWDMEKVIDHLLCSVCFVNLGTKLHSGGCAALEDIMLSAEIEIRCLHHIF